MSSRSQSPSSSAWACSVKTAASSLNAMFASSGSDEDGRRPLGPMDPGDETAPRRRRVAVRGPAGDGRRRAVHLRHPRLEAVLPHRQAVRAERAGLDDVRAGLEVGVVHPLDRFGLLQREVVVAADVAFAAEVGGRELLPLHLGSHRAVEYHDLGGQRVQVPSVGELGRRPDRRAPRTALRADRERLGRRFGQPRGQLLQCGLAYHARHDQFPADRHDVDAADALEPPHPLDDLERDLEAFLLRVRRALQPGDQRLGNPDPGDLRHHPGRARAADGRDADEERRASQGAGLVERFEVLLERVHVVDQVALEELRARVRLLQLALRLRAWRGRARRRGGAEEQARRRRHAAAVEPDLRVAHPPQDPEHLDRIQIPGVHASVGRRAHARVVTGETEDVAYAERGGAEDLRLKPHPRPVPGRDLHDGLDALLDRERRARKRRHARRRRRVVGEIRRVDVVAQDVEGAGQLVRGHRQRRRHLAGHDERTREELLFERGHGLVRRRGCG